MLIGECVVASFLAQVAPSFFSSGGTVVLAQVAPSFLFSSGGTVVFG